MIRLSKLTSHGNIGNQITVFGKDIIAIEQGTFDYAKQVHHSIHAFWSQAK